MKWLKGNLHCHSTRSDGKLNPSRLARYYKNAGFDFLGLSDHNISTPFAKAANSVGLIPIPACEYTGKKCCHVVCIGVDAVIAPEPGEGEVSKTEILQDGVDKSLAAGGLPIICHPLWHWALTAKDMLKVKGWRHFELCNASPDCNSIPTPGFSPAEMLWDELLTKNHRAFGLASDDAHHYYTEYSPRAPLGGRGWIVVRVPRVTPSAILKAISEGHFYASTGLELSRLSVTEKDFSVAIQPFAEELASVEFFGAGGRLLQRSVGQDGSYCFTGHETYVRARLTSTTGACAWTQPVFLDELKKTVAWTQA